MVDALLVCTGILRDRVARTSLLHAHRHVVLVGTIAAVVDPIAQLVPGDALMVGALEPPVCITLEVRYAKRIATFILPFLLQRGQSFSNKLTAHDGILVRIVTAIVGAVADIVQRDAKIVVTLESRLRAVPSSRVSRWTVDLVTHVAAISRSVATKI